MTEQELIEQLADKEHASWARWMEYLFSRCTRQQDGSMVISARDADYWQLETLLPYADLPEQIKRSDRKEVAHIMPIIREYVSQFVDPSED
jgi:hypothetical protein